MAPYTQNLRADNSGESEVDTLELELSPQQLNELTEIAEARPASPPRQGVGIAPHRRVLTPRSRQRPRRRALWTLILVLTALAVASATVVALLWSREAKPPPPHPAAAPLPPPAQATQGSPAPPDPPVRVRNPFDAGEWFEFPAGTPLDQARAQVAEQLLERARGRRSDPGFTRGLQHRIARTHAPGPSPISAAKPPPPSG